MFSRAPSHLWFGQTVLLIGSAHGDLAVVAVPTSLDLCVILTESLSIDLASVLPMSSSLRW